MQADSKQIDELIERLGAIRPPNVPPAVPPLPPGGGDGRIPDMEGRLASLEAHMDHVRDSLKKLEGLPERISKLEVKVDHLPGKGFVVGSSLTAITLITALLIMLQKLGVLT